MGWLAKPASRPVAGGRFALAGHLLEVQMKLELEQPDQPAPIAPFLAAKDIAPLCHELGSACRAALASDEDRARAATAERKNSRRSICIPQVRLCDRL